MRYNVSLNDFFLNIVGAGTSKTVDYEVNTVYDAYDCVNLL